MFIDEAKIYVTAGQGGDGCHSFYRDKYCHQGRPDGGEGGDGGDVIFIVDVNVQTLLDLHYRQHVVAESGGHASSNHKAGARGADMIVKVPPGTIVKEFGTDLILRDLVRVGDTVIVAKGGRGGRGNSRNHDALDGSPGESKTIKLELKLIADAGIIGYPNAGKSTLISHISSAHPKIANYPFTTTAPVLGVVRAHEEATFVVAEIPGLIEGAHEGRGLGDRFLRHIERTKILVHLVDAAGIEGRDPIDDYITLNKELKLYSKALGKKPQVVVLNKVDVPEAKANIKKFKKRFPKLKPLLVSAATGEGLKELTEALYKTIQKAKKSEKG